MKEFDKQPVKFSGEPLSEIRISDWYFLRGPETMINPELKEELEHILSEDYVAAFKPKYPYFFWEETGHPSPVVRVDLSPPDDISKLKEQIYEIEARPAGLGIITNVFGIVLPFKTLIEQLTEYFGKRIAAKVLPSIAGNGGKDRREDTRLFAESVGIEYFDINDLPGDINEYLMWSRGGVEDWQPGQNDQMIDTLEKYALAPVRDHGNKRYLVEMGLAEIITEPGQIDFSKPFCVKPLEGSKCQGVGIWYPQNREIPGVDTKSKIGRLLTDNKDYIIQSFIPPKTFEYQRRSYHYIDRLFALLNLASMRYEIVGGIYTMRPNLRVHGANDAIIGLTRPL